MAKVRLQCPSCGSEVELGDIECKNCGVNLKSGETYETRVKQAKGKATHPEQFAGRVYMGVTVAFALCAFAGLMYQRAVEKTIKDRPDLFKYPVLKLEEIDGLVAMGSSARDTGDADVALQRFKRARKETEDLISWLVAHDKGIKLEQLYSSESALQAPPGSRRKPEEPEYNKRLAKRILQNLKAKAEHKLNEIPTT